MSSAEHNGLIQENVISLVIRVSRLLGYKRGFSYLYPLLSKGLIQENVVNEKMLAVPSGQASP